MVTQLYYIELILTNDPNSEWILIKLNSEPASDCQRFAAWDEERLPCTELTCDFDPHCKASLPAGSAQVWLLQRAIGWRRKCSLPSFPSTSQSAADGDLCLMRKLHCPLQRNWGRAHLPSPKCSWEPSRWAAQTWGQWGPHSQGEDWKSTLIPGLCPTTVPEWRTCNFFYFAP
jgi:hypothetical protein